jgi:hypothetical protein
MAGSYVCFRLALPAGCGAERRTREMFYELMFLKMRGYRKGGMAHCQGLLVRKRGLIFSAEPPGAG